MQSDAARLGVTLAAIVALMSALGLVLASLGAAWWVLIGYLIWFVFWIIAALGLGDAASRKFLCKTLNEATYTQIYTTLTRRLLTPLWTRLCDPAPDKAPWPTQFRAALTWRLYDRALLIAVAYPILLLVGQWVWTGDEGRVGSFIVLREAAFWPERALMIVMLLILTAGFVGQKLASASQRPTWEKLADWMPLAAVAVAVAGAVAFAFAVAVAAAAAAAAAFAIEYLDKRERQRAARALITAMILVLVPVLALTIDWSAIPEDRRSLFLFLAVLPLLNALFDVISYAATLSLTRRGLQSRLPLLWGLADLALACLLFLALGATLVAAIHALNLLAGVPFIDLPALFEGAAPPSWAYFWLYAMLFSTILPTALHAALSLLGLQGIWPRPLRRHVAKWIDTATTSPLASFRASLALGLIWTLPVLALMLIAAALWWLSADAIRWTLAHYLDALLWIATHPLNAL